MTSGVPVDPADSRHVPVMMQEVLSALQVQRGGRYIDGTLGGGGHARAILQAAAPEGCLLALDADPAALRRVQKSLTEQIAGERLVLVHSRFEHMGTVAAEHGFTEVDGILLDLGLSSFQLETADRGFAFSLDGPLDMRFDPTSGESAADLVNHRPENEIADLIYRYGDEHRSRRIARTIVAQRPFHTTRELADAVGEAVGGRRGARIHPATKTFQALRIAVNDELGQLERVLPQAMQLLRTGGRLAVISFHSLEDRIVKEWMRTEARSWIPDPTHPLGGSEQKPVLRLVGRKPTSPAKKELEQNPRSRSAHLRVAEKIEVEKIEDEDFDEADG